MPNIHINDPKQLEKKIVLFKKDGVPGFHIISDFDKTLTKAFVDKKKVRSTYSLLREGKYLTPDYPSRAYAEFDKYHPYETDTELSFEEKSAKMVDWWKVHWELMIECGMDKEVIDDLITKQKLQLRSGAHDFLTTLASRQVPILIFSAGIGDIIKEFLHDAKLLTPNVHVISNFFEFDEKGKAIGYKKPLIHVFNKNETEVKGTPYHGLIEKCRNVILLGDNIGDLGMTEGINHDCIIKIGFLNDKKEQLFDSYSKAFDVVILDDGPMDYVNELVNSIIQP